MQHPARTATPDLADVRVIHAVPQAISRPDKAVVVPGVQRVPCMHDDGVQLVQLLPCTPLAHDRAKVQVHIKVHLEVTPSPEPDAACMSGLGCSNPAEGLQSR